MRGSSLLRILAWAAWMPMQSVLANSSEAVTYDLDIASQPLGQALQEFAKQSDIQIIFFSRVTEGHKAPALKGKFTAAAALGRLLGNSKLTIHTLNPKTIEIRPLVAVNNLEATSANAANDPRPGGDLKNSHNFRQDEEPRLKMNATTKKTHVRRGLAVLFAFLAGGGGAGNVMAQEVGARSGTLEEIIVTARKREESLMETPVSITAFSGAELQARQIDSVDQISQATPGLVFTREAGHFAHSTRIFIRGVGQDDFVPTKQPGVGLYVDGAYIAPWAGSLIDMVDIQTIEVLRGPQGTLFGRNTIGGAVQVNTVKPSNEFSADVEALAGRFDRWRVKGQVNVPITDTFYAKFSGLFQEKDGYIDTPNIPNDDGLGGDDIGAARVALRWVPSDALTLDLSGEYSKQQSDGLPNVLGSPTINNFTPGGLTQAGEYNVLVAPNLGLPSFTAGSFLGPETYTSLETRKGKQETEAKGVNLTVQWDVGNNLTLKSITGYREVEAFGLFDFDSSPSDVAVNVARNDGEHWSQEFQLSGIAFEERLRWLVGLYHYEEKVTSLEPIEFPLFHAMSGAKIDNQSSAIFSQATYAFTEKWNLTLGGRYTDEKLKSIADDDLHYLSVILCAPAFGGPVFGGAFGPPPLVAACAARGPGFAGYASLPAPPDPLALPNTPNGNGAFRKSQTAFEPYLNLAYHFTDDLLAYVSYSEGFKGGGFTQRLTPGRVIESFGPEFAQVYEIGSKWSGDRLQVSGAVFYNDYTDLQVQTLRVPGGNTENAANAVIQGGELEVQAAVTQRLRLSAGVSYLNDEYKNVDPAVAFSPNNSIPFLKEWQVNAAASYRFPLASGELIARLDYFYSDDYFIEADNLPELFLDSYYLLNAGLTYIHSSKRWEVGLQGRNITDEYYRASGAGNRNVFGWTQFFVGPPAEWSARFAYHF